MRRVKESKTPINRLLKSFVHTTILLRTIYGQSNDYFSVFSHFRLEKDWEIFT